MIQPRSELGKCKRGVRNDSDILSEKQGNDTQKKKEHYQKNRERILEQQKEYYQKNREKIRQTQKQYREKNKSKINNCNILTYHFYKKNGICVLCQNENAVKGKNLCFDCLSKQRDYGKRIYEKIRDKKLEREKRRYDLLKAFGVCTRCKRRDASAGKTLCIYCSSREKNNYKNYYREKKGVMPRELMGKGEYCYICGQKVNKYEKTCDKCHDRLAKQMVENVRKHLNDDNNFFKKTNSLFFKSRKY